MLPAAPGPLKMPAQAELILFEVIVLPVEGPVRVVQVDGGLVRAVNRIARSSIVVAAQVDPVVEMSQRNRVAG